MYIGWRTVFDGVIDLISSDGGCYFEMTQPREIWLFVESDRKNPIRVFPEQVCAGEHNWDLGDGVPSETEAPDEPA